MGLTAMSPLNQIASNRFLNKTKRNIWQIVCENIFLHNRQIKLRQTIADQSSVYIDLSASDAVSSELMLLYLLRYREGWGGGWGRGGGRLRGRMSLGQTKSLEIPPSSRSRNGVKIRWW